VISSFWSDGQPLGEGLWSERTAVVAVDHGRLLHATAKIHHGYSGIEREVRIDAVDELPGGLVAAGWTPDPATSPPARRSSRPPGSAGGTKSATKGR
jgi:hypothetical protein